ncbi:MAG: SHOCT domain-containing protein [Actinomycetota bacterium]
MGLKDLLSGGGGMDDPVRGTAQVVSASANRGRGIFQTCNLQLVVQAEDVPATAVSFSGLVHRDRWPMPGMVLPVTIDRSDPQNVNIKWDEVRSSKDRSRENAENLAAMMRGEGAAASASMVVNLSGRDLSQLSEEQKARLRTLGIDPDAIAAQTSSAGASPPPPPAAGEEVDERVARLERLARLKEQDVLTDEEFRAQKRQILEG